jgi:hypothetical protein
METLLTVACLLAPGLLFVGLGGGIICGFRSVQNEWARTQCPVPPRWARSTAWWTGGFLCLSGFALLIGGAFLVMAVLGQIGVP